MSLIVSTSRLSYWTTTRSFIVARSSGAMSMSGAAVMSIPPLWMLRWRGKPSIRAHSSSQRSQSDSPTMLPPRGWGGGSGSTRATLECGLAVPCRRRVSLRRRAAPPSGRAAVPCELRGPGRGAGAARCPNGAADRAGRSDAPAEGGRPTPGRSSGRRSCRAARRSVVAAPPPARRTEPYSRAGGESAEAADRPAEAALHPGPSDAADRPAEAALHPGPSAGSGPRSASSPSRAPTGATPRWPGSRRVRPRRRRDLRGGSTVRTGGRRPGPGPGVLDHDACAVGLDDSSSRGVIAPGCAARRARRARPQRHPRTGCRSPADGSRSDAACRSQTFHGPRY